MKCVIGNVNLGTWCRAIHSLTQVGDEDIYFDFSDTILTMSTANASFSTFATFLFFRPFFTSYQMTSPQSEKVVIPSKIILKPYKTLRVAKTYISSELNYSQTNDFITVTSESRSRASVTYKLGSSSSTDDITLDCDPDSLKHCLKADAKILSSCLANFSHVKGLAEITLKIQGSKVTLRNCVTDTARKDGSVVTEYYLSSHDFDHFAFQDESTELTFGFREFKIFTTFAEQLKLPVCIHFQEKEDPVMITIRTDLFEARLCMATRMNDPFANPSQTPGSSNATPLSSGTNGRISNVTSQNSSTSSRSTPSQEVHRQRRDARSVSTASALASANPPPPKRPRRTEAIIAPPSSPPAASIVMEQDRVEEVVPVNIGNVIEALEKRQKSNAYKSIQMIISAPAMTEEEYLKTIPGHDVVLCPDSDEENDR